MINLFKSDDRGFIHWQAILVFVLVAVVFVVGFMRVANVHNIDLSAGTSSVGKLAPKSAASSKESISDDEADSNKCFAKLQTEFGSESVDKVRERMLSRITYRQAKTAEIVSSNAVSKLPNDFKARVVNRLGKPNQTAPGSVQGDLNAAAAFIKTNNNSAALMRKTCDTIVTTRVYIFWPNYINTLAKAEVIRKNSGKLDAGVKKSVAAFEKSGKDDNPDLSRQLSNLRDSRDKINSSQDKLTKELLSLEPTSVNGSITTKKLFGGYTNQIKQVSAQQRELSNNIKSFAKNLKKAPRSQRAVYKEYAKALMQSNRLSDQDGRYISQIKSIANGDFSCNVNPTILKMLYGVVVKDHHRIEMSSLNRRCTGVLTASGTSSYHYRDGGGHAIDVIKFDGMPVVGSGEGAVKYLHAASKYLPKNTGYGQVESCHANFKIPHGSYAVPDTCNHTHIQVPTRQIKQ